MDKYGWKRLNVFIIELITINSDIFFIVMNTVIFIVRKQYKSSILAVYLVKTTIVNI